MSIDVVVLLSGAEAELVALFVPGGRQACVIHEAARGQFGRVLARHDGVDNVRGKERQAIEPRRVGWHDILGLGDLFQSEAAVVDRACANDMGAHQKVDGGQNRPPR